MDDAPYSLAYSPCPNDTYIFAALTNHLLDDAPNVRVVLEDIENLNDAAGAGQFELTKVSYGAIPQLMDQYRILRSGGALGRGCGPLLIARPGTGNGLEDFADKLVAIPGERTTAFMLLQLALGERPPVIQMRFDQIVEAVASGDVDAGLIIHESRFTYAASGLVQVVDLGDWWETTTSLPIPLGAILVRDDIDDAQARKIDDAIRRSLAYARAHDAAIMPYVRRHAVEMDDEVMRKHIALYVNEFSNDLGEIGVRAVLELFKRAHEAEIIPEVAAPVFV